MCPDMVERPRQDTNSSGDELHGLGKPEMNVPTRVLPKGQDSETQTGTVGPYDDRLGHRRLQQQIQ